MAHSPQDYHWYYAALAGNFGPIHENEPHCGFYRRKASKKGEPIAWQEVAIWREDDGGLVCTVGNKPVDPIEVWTWVCRHPVSWEDYQGFQRDGKWPDEIKERVATVTDGSQTPQGEALGPASASPTSSEENVSHETHDPIVSAIAAATEEIGLALTLRDKAWADRLAVHREVLTRLWKTNEAARKAEKKPFDDGAKAVQAKYEPVLSRLKIAGEAVARELTSWLKEEDKKRAEEVRKTNDPERRAELEAKRVRAGGTTARTVSLRTTTKANIVDYAMALQACALHPLVKEAVQKVADQTAKSGMPLAGTEIIEEQRAV